MKGMKDKTWECDVGGEVMETWVTDEMVCIHTPTDFVQLDQISARKMATWLLAAADRLDEAAGLRVAKESPVVAHSEDSTMVTVCKECRMASCWQGVHLCQKSTEADTIELSIATLTAEAREHPEHWDVCEDHGSARVCCGCVKGAK